MPIKPENKHRYPANWKEIRAAILERAGHRCEKCNAVNRSKINRGIGIHIDTYMNDLAEVYDANTGDFLFHADAEEYQAGKIVDIVLTIAHLDHTPENVDENNLRAWCQRCHLRYDAAHHAETARKTRREKLALGDLLNDAAGVIELHESVKSNPVINNQ